MLSRVQTEWSWFSSYDAVLWLQKANPDDRTPTFQLALHRAKEVSASHTAVPLRAPGGTGSGGRAEPGPTCPMPWQCAEQQNRGVPGAASAQGTLGITRQMVPYSRFSLLLPVSYPTAPHLRVLALLPRCDSLPTARGATSGAAAQRCCGGSEPPVRSAATGHGAPEDAPRGRKGSLLPFCLEDGTDGSVSQHRRDARGRGCSERVPRTRLAQFPLPGTQLPAKNGEGRRGVLSGIRHLRSGLGPCGPHASQQPQHRGSEPGRAAVQLLYPHRGRRPSPEPRSAAGIPQEGLLRLIRRAEQPEVQRGRRGFCRELKARLAVRCLRGCTMFPVIITTQQCGPRGRERDSWMG